MRLSSRLLVLAWPRPRCCRHLGSKQANGISLPFKFFKIIRTTFCIYKIHDSRGKRWDMENIGNDAAEIPAPIIQNWEYYKIQVKTAIQYQSRMILSFNFQISELQTPLSSKKRLSHQSWIWSSLKTYQLTGNRKCPDSIGLQWTDLECGNSLGHEQFLQINSK